jgi:putative FmdB family regulatory protein
LFHGVYFRPRHPARSGLPALRFMPIYEYELVEGDCKVCGGRFELRRPADRAPLTACPLCRKPVRKIVSQINTPKLTKPLSVSDAKKAGFTVLHRMDEGVYEKQ